MHLIARTKSKLNDKYGIGLTADELYKKAIAINPDKQINLVSYNAGIQNLFYNDEQCQLLLLRSAYYGHPDAIVELFPYIAWSVQIAYADYYDKSKFWKKWEKKNFKEAYMYENSGILDDIAKILDGVKNIPQMKEYSFIWDILKEEVNDTRKNLNTLIVNHIHEQEAEKRAKRERRSRFWGNVAGAMLQGLAAGVNTYMAANNYGTVPMNAAVLPQTGYTGSLADALSQPGYFQREQQRLLQQSMNQVQLTEIQEYSQAREAYQRMGWDLSLDEFRAMQGQAIMDAKNQEYGNNTNSYDNNDTYNNSSSHSHSGNSGGYVDCHICHGSGVCPTCNGSGVVTNYGRTSECPNCWLQNMQRTGKCGRCQGKGKVFKSSAY